MRIAMVSEHADPTATLGGEDSGGQNVHVAALASGLARRGHSVIIYTRLADPGAARTVELRPGVTVRRLPAGPAASLPKDELLPHMLELGDRLRDEWLQCRPDLVHAHFWMSGLAALRARAGLGIPVATTFHALGVVKARHQGAKDTSPAKRIEAERQVALACDQVIATCCDEVRELAGLGIPSALVSVVPCGVDTAMFRPGCGNGERAGRPRLLTLGRLVERKGTDTAIAAIPFLPGAELVIAGGPDSLELDSHPEVRRLRSLADACGVSDRVTFTGSVARKRVPALVRSADVVVCTPWYEPFGIVPLEAMACGVPVIASRVGGLTDTVVDGSTGLLVPPRDLRALADACRKLLGDRELRASYGLAGARRARRWYSWDRVARETEAVYRRLDHGAQLPSPAGVDLSITAGAI
ncbi:MAG TPA: glycosyltransferase [Streptosporangiaceae bacterium]|nr:glycosyltransferase [Streptosporangiaceae bacterium]